LIDRSGEKVERRFARFLFSAGKPHIVPGRFPGSEVTAFAVDRFTFPSTRLSGNRNGFPRNSGGTALGLHQLPY
jgi:hypothetical protein